MDDIAQPAPNLELWNNPYHIFLPAVNRWEDFQNWSPADVMNFVHEVLPEPEHAATIASLSALRLDGDFLTQLTEEPESAHLLPIPPEAYRALRNSANLIVCHHSQSQNARLVTEADYRRRTEEAMVGEQPWRRERQRLLESLRTSEERILEIGRIVLAPGEQDRGGLEEEMAEIRQERARINDELIQLHAHQTQTYWRWGEFRFNRQMVIRDTAERFTEAMSNINHQMQLILQQPRTDEAARLVLRFEEQQREMQMEWRRLAREVPLDELRLLRRAPTRPLRPYDRQLEADWRLIRLGVREQQIRDEFAHRNQMAIEAAFPAAPEQVEQFEAARGRMLLQAMDQVIAEVERVAPAAPARQPINYEELPDRLRRVQRALEPARIARANAEQ